MKRIIPAFVLLALLSYGCGEQPPPQKAKVKPDYSAMAEKYSVEDAANAKKKGYSPAKKTTTETTAKTTQAKADTDAQSSLRAASQSMQVSPIGAMKTPESSSSSSSSGSAVNSVINYGTGATALSIKQKTTQKLKNIQDSHNQAVEKSAKDN